MLKKETPSTFFDSVERLPHQELGNKYFQFKRNPLIDQLLEGFPELAVIINRNRQLVAFNSQAMQIFRTENPKDIVGKRIGEAINCIYSNENPGGCGTSRFCKACGAAKAIKNTIDNNINSDEECSISAMIDGNIVSMDFHVHTRSLDFEGETYTVFSVRDISNEKRREALERIFFHDALNTVQAIKGLSELLSLSLTKEEIKEITTSINSSTRQLMHEIKAQSVLRAAEDGNLKPVFLPTSLNSILREIAELYQNNPFHSDKKITFQFSTQDAELITDSSLLIRSLSNLIKNALEASSIGEEIIINTSFNNDKITFSVWNPKVIPPDLQIKLFQRSFSTKKGKGHGIGLYSVKLLVQQYLKGIVDYKSSEGEGTIFSVTIPISPY